MDEEDPNKNPEDMSRETQTSWIVAAIIGVGLGLGALLIHLNRDPQYLECAGFFGPSLECKADVAMKRIMRGY